MKHFDEELLVEAYYGAGDAEVREHLTRCEECRLEFARLKEFLDGMREAPLPERDAAYGAEVWARVAPRLPHRRTRATLLGWRGLRWWTLTPVAAAAIVLAFVAGMLTQHRLEPAKGFSATARERVLLEAMAEHLERSEVLLTELVNTGAADTDLAREREQARDLVTENRLLRQTVAHAGEVSYAGLLDDLERMLLDVANGPREGAPDQLRFVQQRIENEGLLFKVRVTSEDAREKERKL